MKKILFSILLTITLVGCVTHNESKPIDTDLEPVDSDNIEQNEDQLDEVNIEDVEINPKKRELASEVLTLLKFDNPEAIEFVALTMESTLAGRVQLEELLGWNLEGYHKELIMFLGMQYYGQEEGLFWLDWLDGTDGVTTRERLLKTLEYKYPDLEVELPMLEHDDTIDDAFFAFKGSLEEKGLVIMLFWCDDSSFPYTILTEEEYDQLMDITDNSIFNVQKW